MIKIPPNNKWYQSNRGDLNGSIWSSFNIDLTSKPGVLRNTRMLSVGNSTDVSGLGIAVAFRYFNGGYWAATGTDDGAGTISTSGTPVTAGFQLAGSSPPTTLSSRYSDMEVFNEKLYVSLAGTNLAKNTAGTWGTVAITGASSNVPKPICVYGERLYVGATAGGINSMNTAETFGATIGTSASTLQLTNPTSNTITFLRATSSRIWIGTVNQLGGRGTIYAWDGTQTSVNETYKLESSGALAAVVKDDVLYVMDANGKLLAFNGGSFQEIDRLPIKYGEYLFFPLGSYNSRWIHPNGMTVQDDRILILINNEYRGATASTEENVPSGIWEWTKETGLYHKYSLSYHAAISGSVTDYGQNNVDGVGALTYIKSFSTSATDNGSLLAGAVLFTGSSSTSVNHILIDDLNDTIQKYGYLVTPWIFSQSVEDSFPHLYVRHKKLLTATDKIIVKKRIDDTASVESAITWVDTDTFTVTAANVPNLAVGDEVEIIQGVGSGKCAHVSSFTGTTTLTVNLDDTFTGVGTGTAKARFQKWIKCGEGADQTVQYHPFPTASNNTRIQIKMCFQFTGADEINDVVLINKTNKAE